LPSLVLGDYLFNNLSKKTEESIQQIL
jgi:hypothetical protein